MSSLVLLFTRPASCDLEQVHDPGNVFLATRDDLEKLAGLVHQIAVLRQDLLVPVHKRNRRPNVLLHGLKLSDIPSLSAVLRLLAHSRPVKLLLCCVFA